MTAPGLTKPTFEHHHSGLGIGCRRPRISWRFLASENTVAGWEQDAYEVEIQRKGVDKPEVHKIEGAQSVLVPWAVGDLHSRESAMVRVRSFASDKSSGLTLATEWSPAATVEAGLHDRQDWKAQFIGSANPGLSEKLNDILQPLRFRKEFTLPADHSTISQARLYISGLGVFDAYLNGHAASDELLAPGWTSYKHRLNYRVLDVTDALKGDQTLNALCIEVAEGWYAGRLGFLGGKRFIYGNEVGILAQLEVRFKDSLAPPWTLVSDDSWHCSLSAIQHSGFYDGELYDASKEFNWLALERVVSGDTRWSSTKVLDWPGASLVAPDCAPVRVTETIKPVEILKSKSGKTIVDFGQNLVGKIQVKSMDVPSGARVSFRHAEVLEHGELGTRPLRKARSEDVYVGNGTEILEWLPKFAVHGFRYVQINGWEPEPHNIVALVMHTDFSRRGHFSCSNSWVNKLHENVVWSTRGNFVSIPTDCPQRDERLGWTGDAQVFAKTASFLFDTTSLFAGWLKDVMSEQLEEGKGGIPPLVVPGAALPSNWPHMPQAVWDDVTVLTPSEIFLYSGDKAILDDQLPSMIAWLDQAIDRGEDGLWNFDQWQLADWLDPTAPPSDPGAARTDSVLVADAYLVHVTKRMSDVCSAIDRHDLAQKYASDAEKLEASFQFKYLTPAGNLMSNTQTGLSLAIEFGLYPSTQALSLGARQLAKQVRAAKFNIATGFAGTPVICHALTSSCHPQLAYRMLLEKSCPSWLYPVSMGATTTWERWDSMLPDGSINPGEMTSFNHYALGSVADWLHATVGGLSPAEPGWKIIQVRPVPGGNITSAEVSFDGPYGLIECSWKLQKSHSNGEDQNFEMKLNVPPNSSALVTLHRAVDEKTEERSINVKSGFHTFKCSWRPDPWPPSPITPAHQKPTKDRIAS